MLTILFCIIIGAKIENKYLNNIFKDNIWQL